MRPRYLVVAIWIFIVCVFIAIITVLCWLLSEQGKSLQQSEMLAHRDRVDSRARYLEIITNQQSEIRALTESLVRSDPTTAKSYIHPIILADGKVADRPITPNPPKRAFAFKPPPPMTENSPAPKVGMAAKEPDGSHGGMGKGL